MRPLMESVPNFSEGRDLDVVRRIAEASQSVPGVKLLNIHTDSDHNRCVLTLVGERDALAEGVFRAVARATELIDLRRHSGKHPRLGASDVVPFIPLGETAMSTAVQVARALGRRVADELAIPVYFYEEAALREERRRLELIRGKGFEDLLQCIQTDDDRIPDLGPRNLHPSAGAVVIGARDFLIAYNIFLGTNDVEVARSIARRVRFSSGGLRYVKALGLEMASRGQVQVSMNLTNYRRTAMHTVFELVRAEAESFGVSIVESELVGLAPMDALVDVARHYLRLRRFTSDQVLESRIFLEE